MDVLRRDFDSLRVGVHNRGAGDVEYDPMAPVSTGTTLIACEYDGGVVIGSDSRTSSGTFIVSRMTDKLTQLTEKIYCCRSGSAADTQALADVVAYRLTFQEVQEGRPARVRIAAKLFQDMCYQYRDDMSAGIIVAGYDPFEGGQVYSIPLGGMMVRQKLATGGSGSIFTHGYSDFFLRPETKISREEALKLVADMVALAIGRDCSSGGVVRLAVINSKGVERFDLINNDIPRLEPM